MLDNGLGVIDALLRDRTRFLDALREGALSGAAARGLILCIAAAGAVLGATLGSYRGGEQVLYAAVKLPLAVLATTALSAPIVVALAKSIGGRADWSRSFLLLLASLALGTLVAAALAPVLLLTIQAGATYQQVTLVLVGCCGVGGLCGLVLFARGLSALVVKARLLAAFVLICAFCVVATQVTWTLRPFLLRPRTLEVPFVRSIEGSFVDAALRSWESSLGRYHRAAAPLPAPR